VDYYGKIRTLIVIVIGFIYLDVKFAFFAWGGKQCICAECVYV